MKTIILVVIILVKEKHLVSTALNAACMVRRMHSAEDKPESINCN